MSDPAERRRALNQAVARDSNELAQHVAAAWDPPADPLDIRCECSRVDCTQTLRLSLDEYESVRDDPRQFVLFGDHADESVDRVVGRIRSYLLVEKVGEEATRIADETDPRA